jgi:hypothetical protein
MLAASADVAALSRISGAGRALLRHTTLYQREARLAQAMRELRRREPASAEIAGFERELSAVRRELQQLNRGR